MGEGNLPCRLYEERVFIYLVTNLINGKKYVGKTSKTIEERWKAHVCNARGSLNTYLCNAIRKYGADNFSITKLAEAQDEYELNALEVKFIEDLDTHNTGYNLTRGGDGVLPSAETLRKMSESHKGKPNLRKGIPHTSETRLKIASTLRSKIANGSLTVPTTRGMKFSIEIRQKMSETRKGRTSFWKGKTLPPEMVEKMRKGRETKCLY